MSQPTNYLDPEVMVTQVEGDHLIPLAQAAIRREAAILRQPMEGDSVGHRYEMEKRANLLNAVAEMLTYLDHVI